MTNDNSLQLEDRVAIVTGGGSRGEGIGTGRGACIVLARRGARVLVADRDVQAAQSTVELIREEGGVAEMCRVDVLDAQSCIDTAQAAIDLWGRIDILDNNVGIGAGGSVLNSTEEMWDRTLATNVKSVVSMSKAVLPHLISAGSGVIINIASIAAWRPNGATPYTTSKGAVIALTRAMAIDHGRHGIRVNCVAPGPIYTPMVAAQGLDAQMRERRRTASLLEIEGTGWDVGEAVAFLSSDAARYITGVTLPVDGGVSVRSPDR